MSPFCTTVLYLASGHVMCASIGDWNAVEPE